MSRLAKQSGFTIVELLIVVVVVAILATISAVAYSGVQTRANDASRVADVDAVKKFLELYYVDNGHYIKSDYFLNSNALSALTDGPLKGLPPEALRGPGASDSTVSSWGQWGGNVTVNGSDYAIKTYTNTGGNCVGDGFSSQDCSRYEIIYKTEVDDSHVITRGSNGW